jgi:uncharacterized protein (TIGR03382 family)
MANELSVNDVATALGAPIMAAVGAVMAAYWLFRLSTGAMSGF